MRESTAAFIAILSISVLALLVFGTIALSTSINQWEHENCPVIMEQQTSDVHWADVRRCQGYES